MENLTRYRPGEKIETLIWRSGKKMNISVTLKNHLNSLEPVGIYKSGILEKIGIEVRNLDGVEHSLFGKSGVLVLSIKTVSYTHLDVYKRQVLSCSDTSKIST